MKNTPSESAYAGFAIRFAAMLIDWIITFVIPTIALATFWALTQNPLFLFITFLWWAIIGNFYYIYFHHKTGQTIGKKLLAIKVIKTDGNSLSWIDAFLRWLGYGIGEIPLGLGQIWIAIDDKKQGWHDKIANTYVVKVKVGHSNGS